MREIKFRAWDKEKKEWYRPTFEAYKGNLWELLVSFSGELVARTIEDGKQISEHQSRWPERYEIMQFTGLKDKNGKEIYEGDVVKSYVGQGEVKFGSYMAGGQDYYASYAYGFYIQRSKYEDDTETLGQYCEILGNIYENPELLTN